MSDEQSAETPTAQTPVDITERATNPAPKPREKNPKRVEAAKVNAEKTRKAREAQKKALAEAEAKIANYEAKRKDAPEPDDSTTVNEVPPKESVYWGFSTTQWLMVAGTLVSLLGIYAKREEISAAHAKLFNAGTTVCTPAPAAVTPAPNVDTTDPKARQAPGISKMD